MQCLVTLASKISLFLNMLLHDSCYQKIIVKCQLLANKKKHEKIICFWINQIIWIDFGTIQRFVIRTRLLWPAQVLGSSEYVLLHLKYSINFCHIPYFFESAFKGHVWQLFDTVMTWF